MRGSFLALADDETETVILNWKTQEYAVMKSPVDASLWRVCPPIDRRLALMMRLLEPVHSGRFRI